jgi:RNA polymerase sigma-54 factor
MVDLRLQTNITQTLELLLSPRLLQMLKVLQLPYLEYVDQVNKEAEENVMLEVERKDEYVEFLRYLTSDQKIKKEADFSELPGLENIGRVEKTLEEHLLEQIDYADLEEKDKLVAREIVENIDDQGYLLAYPALRERVMEKFQLSRPTVDKILKVVQSFEPDGVGARDLKECLLLQIAAYDFESAELEALLTKVVENHLADIEAKNFGKIAASLGIPETGVEGIVDFIKHNLNPNPGALFGGQACQVIPSFAVEKKGKDYKVVNLETTYGPLIKLSPSYLKMLDDPKTDDKTREFLKERLKRAKELMEDTFKRKETMEKIANRIVASQRDFLDQGLIWLKPLSQKSLADEFGLHPSTVSRTVAAKYIQTPHGLFPLKLLCPRGPKGLTAARLKAMIVELINGENKEARLSDEQLSELMKEKGADLDRRTVAYYRKELKIPTAGERGR